MERGTHAGLIQRVAVVACQDKRSDRPLPSPARVVPLCPT